MAAYSRRLARRRKPLSAEFLYLLIVVAAGVMTAWWAGLHAAVNLGGIQATADVLGLTETTGTTRAVGYSQTQSDAARAEAPGAAAYCQAGQAPVFANGLAALKQQVGSSMGDPTECEHPDSEVGNTVQHTSTGLATYNRQTNTDTFTDGWHHWALTPDGLVSWQGTEAQPPLQLVVQIAPAAEHSHPVGADPTH